MKVMICSICGSSLIGYILKFDEESEEFTRTGVGFCPTCEKQIIPLVTPQEV